MAIFQDKFVNFHDHCPKCEHKDKPADEDPCFECLACPVRKFSHQPVNFKEAKANA